MELKVEYIAADKLKPYNRNARKHEEKSIDVIKNSIREFGFNDPIGIWKDGTIIEGHGRYMAGKELGMTEFPVIRLDSLTDEQRKAYTLAHNKTAEISEWDFEILDVELNDIELDMEQFGFEFDEPEGGEQDYYGDERERTFDAYNLDEIDLKRTQGKWQMPLIKKTNHIPKELQSFNYVLSTNNFEKGIHFYIDDYQFERIWNQPQFYLEKLMPYDCILTPDFSLYQEMPLAMQIWNIFRSRLIGQMAQDLGINVIPTLSWCREDSYEFCFDGIEPGGTVSVSTIGVKRDDGASKLWFDGMNEAMRVLKPKAVVVYGGDIGYDFGDAKAYYFSNANADRMKK